MRFYSGISRVTRTMNLLNTSQYVAMRKEAFSNDGIVPTVANAPDIMLWDTTRYTDLKKLLISGTAYSQDLQAGVSGGNDQHQFYIGGGYHSETNVFSRDLTDKRSSLRFSTVHNSSNKKFHLTLTGGYSSDKNRLIQNDLTGFLNLPPNIQLQDSTGNISWSEKGVNFPGVNPLAVFLKKYVSVNDNLQGSLQSSFQFTKQFSVRINTGYMVFGSEESLIEPKASIAPNQSGVASAQFANMQTKNWIAEPQFQYITTLGKAKINMLVGATWQEKISSGKTITASNYTNDLLLYSIEAAGSVVVSNSYSQYRYAAFFGRMNYEYDGKYIVNLSGRRDGSSRFAGERRFANFGAGGIAWIFSGESWIKKGLPFLSFGKLRGSYGVTGNDQIGDYKYLNLWGSSSLTYQGAPGLRPTSLYNPNYNWERNRKFELAIELGFLKDRIQFSAAYYRNRSNNQLINYRLPLQTGFGNVTRNFDALVQNSGLEVAFISKNVLTNSFSWTTNINLTIPRNKLVSFPGLASSSYSGMYLIGQSLSVIYKYRFQGLDTATGLYLYEDLNRDGSINSEDRQSLGHTDCKYYGGIQNELTYKAISFSFFIEGKKHTGRNYLYQHRGSYPGSANNQPILVLNRWQNPGDPGPIQKLTTISSSLAGGTGAIRLFASNGVYGDASFLRLKNISFSYSIPKNLLQRIHMESIQLYINAQNLITLTKYQGSDPETQNYYQLPPLKTIVFGFNLNF
ncbi:MAG TPA: SusC/RagA family TonB-linked outer membrane protein [Chitinophagaceae bacterium]